MGGAPVLPRDKQSQLGLGLGSAPKRRDNVNPSPSSSVSMSARSSLELPNWALEGGEGNSSLGWGGGGNPPDIGGSQPTPAPMGDGSVSCLTLGVSENEIVCRL